MSAAPTTPAHLGKALIVAFCSLWVGWHLHAVTLALGDGDDRVTADDLRGAIAAATRAPAQPLLVEGLLRAFDADGDGAISRAEATAADPAE